MALALDALATAHDKLKTDPKRWYVGGASGGGILATETAFFYPGYFRASFNIVRRAFLERYTVEIGIPGHHRAGKVFAPAWPFLKDSDLQAVARSRPHTRWAFISGENDSNYNLAKASASQWQVRGFAARFLGDQNGVRSKRGFNPSETRIVIAFLSST